MWLDLKPGAGRWGVLDRKTGLLAAIILGAFASYLLLYVVIVGSRGPHPFGDFFALWSYAQIAAVEPATVLYDPIALHGHQVALGMSPADENPFPYPPTFLLMLSPLGWLPYVPALILWVGVTLSLYICAVAQNQGRTLAMAAALVAPTTTLTIVSGQSGFLAGALLVGGLRLLDRRPIIAGVLLGLLTYKPQLGILVPIALVAARMWGSIAAACATVLALVLMSSAVYGWTIWENWLLALPAYARQFDAESVAYNLMPTVTANLAMMGATPRVAQLVQAAVSLSVAIIIWHCCRRGVSTRAIAAVLAGTFLATPHAFVYDMPILTAAVLLIVGNRIRMTGAFGLGEIAILVLALAFPAFMIWAGPHIPISTVPELLLLGLILMEPDATWRRPWEHKGAD